MKNFKEEKGMKRKKKGFTLIELIAVIAILAILGAVLVPKITGYQNKAKKSNYQTSAKTIIHAIQAYNADAADADKISGSFDAAAISKINSNGDVIKATDKYVKDLKDLSLTLDKLANVAAGNFKVNSSGAIDTSSIGTSETFSD